MKQEFIKSFDSRKIFCYIWDDVPNPIGIVQIFHGMAEHAKRYDEFAKFLNKAGYIVFADDHRGHGITAQGTTIGTYDGHDIFYDTLKDEIFFTKMLKEKYKLPIYIFGHSYGSFIAQEYITQCNEYKKAILCGSAFMKKRIDVKLSKDILFFLKKSKGDKPAKFIEKQIYNTYNKMVKDGSWLNTDPEEVKKYYSDKFNGTPLSNKFYFSMFNSFKYIYKPERVRNIPKANPILIISGEKDPVGSMTKSVKQLFAYYKKNNLENVEIKLYPNARHEILKEPNVKKTVFNDVLNFLNK